MKIGQEVMLIYLQSWEQSEKERIDVLNKAAKAAGLKAIFKQGKNGNEWYGKDSEKAAEFQKQLHNVWCGEFNQECRNVEAIIEKFKNK